MAAGARATLDSASLSRTVPRLLLAPIPLFVIQPILNTVANHVARSRPDLFARLGPHLNKRFLIDPVELPFVLVLVPNPAAPNLKAYRRHEEPQHHASITGTFFNLFEMMEGTSDGDALFFARDLIIAGDIEAVVALRNALDDFEGNVADTALEVLGPLSKPAALVISMLRSLSAGGRRAA
jgi:predicted lipid carrier protein YhbT